MLIEQQGLSQAQAAESGRRPAANGQYLAAALPRPGRGRRAGRAAGVAAARQGAADRRRGRQVRGWIADKTPDQLKLPFALWTSRAVRDLITLRFGKTLGLSTVQLYLQRWGMTRKSRWRGPGSASPRRSRPGWRALPGDRQARQGRGCGDLLGRRDRHLQSGPDRPLLCAQGPDPGRPPDGQADHPEHDLGGQQPWPDAVHALRGGSECRPVHRLPAPTEQGRRAEGVPDRRQPQGASRQPRSRPGSPPMPTRSSCSTCRPTPRTTTPTNT